MSEEIRRVRAEKADLDPVLSILDEAARWLASRGIEQWKPGTFRRQRIAGRIESGEMYLAELDGRYVGTLALQWADEETWGEIAPDAAYIHGLAIRREFAGRGLGRELLRWAESRAALADKAYLRLDCGAQNPALNEYYEQAGFGFRGRTWVGDLEVSLYEKRVGRQDRETPAAIILL